MSNRGWPLPKNKSGARDDKIDAVFNLSACPKSSQA